MLFFEHQNFILENGSQILLFAFIKKFNYYSSEIIWDKIKIQRLKNLEISIKKIKPKYNLPEKLKKITEQNKKV